MKEEEAGWEEERDSRKVRERWMNELPGVQEPVDDDHPLPKLHKQNWTSSLNFAAEDAGT